MFQIRKINVPWKKESPRITSKRPGAATETHQCTEVLIVLSGSGVIHYDDGFYSYGKGDVFFILPKVAHSVFPDTQVHDQLWFWPGTRAVWGVLVRSQGAGKKRLNIGRKNMDKRTLCPWCADVLRQANEKNISREKLAAIAMLLAAEYLDVVQSDAGNDTEPPMEQLQDRQRAELSDICEYIEDCGGAGITVEKLARMANYSTAHFSRVFHIMTGMTVHQKVELARRKRYAELRKKNVPQKYIAEELGFSDASAFCQWKRNLQKKDPSADVMVIEPDNSAVPETSSGRNQ